MTEKFLMARIFFRIFTENNPVMGVQQNLFYSRSEGVKQCCRSRFGEVSVSGGLASVSDAKVSAFTLETRRDHNKYLQKIG